VHDTGSEVVAEVPIPIVTGADLLAVQIGLLEVDRFGRTHALLKREERVEVASDASGSWTVQLVEPVRFGHALSLDDRGLGLGHVLALAVDGQGQPHVAWRMHPSMKLGYTSQGPSGWIRQIVDQGAPTGFDPALAFAEGDTPLLLYRAAYKGVLRAAASSAGEWTSVAVDGSARAGEVSGLARGPDGRWHVAYTSNQERRLSPLPEPLRRLRHGVSLPCLSSSTGRRTP